MCYKNFSSVKRKNIKTNCVNLQAQKGRNEIKSRTFRVGGVHIRVHVLGDLQVDLGLNQLQKIREVHRVELGNILSWGNTSEDGLNSITHSVH